MADTPPPRPVPPIETVVETAVYTTDLAAAERFYADVLGLDLLGRDADRHVFFRVGPASMLLIFNPHTTRKGGGLPAHGTTGAGHFALGIWPDTLDEWRRHLTARGIAVEQEVAWPRGGRSLYFRDPAGNAVELVTPSVWGTPAGW
jgi:catechol 2,3-dioxygenase-like lactoylglutathione lyase family enzyme